MKTTTVKDYFEGNSRYSMTEQELHDLYVSCFQQEWQRLRTDPRHAKLSDVDIVEMCSSTSNMLVAYLDNVFSYEIVLAKKVGIRSVWHMQKALEEAEISLAKENK